MKHIKWLSLLLCFVLAFALLAACAPSTDDPGKDPTTSGGEEPGEDLGAVGAFKGTDFYFVDNGALFPKSIRDYTEEELLAMEENGGAPVLGPTTQAQADRVLEMEAKYGIRMIAAGASLWGIGDGVVFAAGLASGEYKADAFHAELQMGRDWYIGGAVESLNKLAPYIDLEDTEKWGAKSLQMACTYKGQTWGVAWHGSSYCPCPYIMYGQMLVNLNTFAQFKLDYTTQSLIEDNQWTFEKFAEILPMVSNTDKANRVRGLGHLGNGKLAMLAIWSNGADLVVYNEEAGKYVFGLDNENAIEAINWTKTIIADTNYVIADTSEKDFLAGKLTYFFPNPNHYLGFDTSYQFVPFPAGPHGTVGKTYATYIQYNDSACGIYKHTDFAKSQATAQLFDELTGPLYIGKGDDAELYQDWLFRQYWEPDEAGQFSYQVYRDQGLNIRWSYYCDLGADLYNTVMTNIATLMQNSGADAHTMLGNLSYSVNQKLNDVVNP